MKDRAFILAAFAVIFLILPGITGIYLYLPDLLTSLDWVKLVLLSLSVTAPVSIINTMVIIGIAKRKKERDDDLFYDFILGSIITGITIYIALVIAYFSGFQTKGLSVLLATGEVMIVFSVWNEWSKGKRKGKKK